MADVRACSYPLHRTMFRLLIAALCLSAASAYSGAAAPAGKTTVFTGSKNAHIYRSATPSQAAPMLVAQPKQARVVRRAAMTSAASAQVAMLHAVASCG